MCLPKAGLVVDIENCACIEQVFVECQEVPERSPSGKGAVSKLRGARLRFVVYAPVICSRLHSQV